MIDVKQIDEVKETESDDFDWDCLIDEIHINRQYNNKKINSKIDLLAE